MRIYRREANAHRKEPGILVWKDLQIVYTQKRRVNYNDDWAKWWSNAGGMPSFFHGPDGVFCILPGPVTLNVITNDYCLSHHILAPPRSYNMPTRRPSHATTCNICQGLSCNFMLQQQIKRQFVYKIKGHPQLGRCLNRHNKLYSVKYMYFSQIHVK